MLVLNEAVDWSVVVVALWSMAVEKCVVGVVLLSVVNSVVNSVVHSVVISSISIQCS